MAARGPSSRRRAALVGAIALASSLACGDAEPPTRAPAPAIDSTSSGSRDPAKAPLPPPGPLEPAESGEAWRPRPRFTWPVASVHITSSFGWRVDPVSGAGTRLHRGLDLRGAVGDLVLSIGAGQVAFVGHDPLLGTMVVIDHGDGLESLYGHLSDVLVAAGVPVDRGAAIGLVGNTGRSAAPHLHLTVKLDGHAIDPLEIIGEPAYRPLALATPVDAPVDAPVNAADSGTTDDLAPAVTPPAAQVEAPIGPPPPRHPLPHRSDDGGER